jgi:hypothetical protein
VFTQQTLALFFHDGVAISLLLAATRQLFLFRSQGFFVPTTTGGEQGKRGKRSVKRGKRQETRDKRAETRKILRLATIRDDTFHFLAIVLHFTLAPLRVHLLQTLVLLLLRECVKSEDNSEEDRAEAREARVL